jgi:hypothetical protein
MKKRTRSIFEELTLYSNNENNQYLIESKSLNLIESAINILDKIEQDYPDQSEELRRKFVNSIRTKDSSKFKRAFSKLCKKTP